MRDYMGPATIALEEENTEELERQRKLWCQEANTYLTRGTRHEATEAGDEPVEPKRKLHRVKAMLWGLALDNSLMVCTGHGLEYYRIPTDDSDPFTWPTLSMAQDQCGDGTCCQSAFAYGWHDDAKYNLDRTDDNSHGGTNDVKNTIKEVGLWHHQLMCCVASSAPFSPFGDGTRRVQVWEAVQELFEIHTVAADEPMLVSHLGELLFERGELWRLEEPGILEEVRDGLKHDPIWTERGQKLSLNRFLATVHHAIAEKPKWTKRLMGLLYAGIKLGFITEKLMHKVDADQMLAKQKKTEQPEKESTKRDDVSAALRKHTVNNLALATLFYGNYENRTKQSIIATVCAPVLDWHVKQNRECRSVH